MRSIRARLTFYLLGSIGLLIVVAGVVLEINMARWLEREFDRSLEAKARSLATLTKQEQGEVELDFADELMPEFESPEDSQYFEIWLDGGKLLERSHSFEVDDSRSMTTLPREPELSDTPRFTDVRLPDGRAGRRARIDFVPQIEDEDDARPADKDEALPRDEPVRKPSEVRPNSRFHVATVLVARERETLDERIVNLLWSLVAFTALLLSTLAALITFVLKIGLGPLHQLAQQVQSLEAESLDRRMNLGSPPQELAPVVDQINELLIRLDTAFRRERQLTSDIAHELKTPIAELRNLCEVGARWPDDPVTARRFFEDAWTIGLQMERVVVHLLALARYDEGAEQVRVERVDVGQIVMEAWKPIEKQAAEKGLVLENQILGGANFETDRDKFRLILSNLLSNAADYSRPGTAITCRFAASNGRSSVSLSNYPAHLEAEDLAVMFDRFWRKDSARTGGHSVGLGLAIVRAFSNLLGLEIQTRLEPGDRLKITLSQAS